MVKFLGRIAGRPAEAPPPLPALPLGALAGGAGRPRTQDAIRARCRAAPAGADTVLCRILGRYDLLVDTADEELAPHLILDGYWEYPVTAHIAREVRPGQTAYDVGANLGYYSVLMADLVGPGGAVHAVEPNPRLAGLAERSLALNGLDAWARVHPVVATDRSGAVFRFQASRSDPKNGHIVPGAILAGAAPDPARIDIAVRGVRLDDLAEGPADFVKVDVEGAEEAAWAGMQGLVARSPGIAILVEVNARRCRDAAALLRDMASGFPLRELGGDGRLRAVTAGDVLARDEDTMLWLTRRG